MAAPKHLVKLPLAHPGQTQSCPLGMAVVSQDLSHPLHLIFSAGDGMARTWDLLYAEQTSTAEPQPPPPPPDVEIKHYWSSTS